MFSRKIAPSYTDQRDQPGTSKENRPTSSTGHRTSTQRRKVENSVHSNKKGDLRQILFAVNVSLSYLSVGVSIAWAAPLVYEAKKYGIHGIHFTMKESSLVGSIMFVTMFITPLPVGILCDHIGRKWALIMAGSVSCVSWLILIILVHRPVGSNKEIKIYLLYTSRILAGCFAGAALTVVPIYVGEIARPKIRGSLTAMAPVMMILGCELTFALGPNVELSVMAITCGLLPHFFLILSFLMPQSPPWLIYKKEFAKAQKNFEWLRGKTLASSEELRDEYMEMVRNAEKDFPKRGYFRTLYNTRASRRAVAITQILTCLQRLTGVSSLIAYITVSIPDQKIGILRPMDVITVLGFAWFIGTFIALVVIDTFGRVPLLVISCIGCFLSNASGATWFYTNRDIFTSPSLLSAHWFPFAVAMAYGFFYLVGIGSVPEVLKAEMFGPANRAFASAITVMTMSASSAFVNLVYFPFAEAFGFYLNFAFYAVSCLVAMVFTLACVPETKGQPLHSIQEELADEF